MKSPALWGALLAFAPAPCLAATLYDSILLAYQTNPVLRAQRAELRALDEGYVQARAGYGPQLSVNAQAAYDTSRVQSGPFLFSGASDTTYSAITGSGDLSLVQPLYTGGATRAQVKGAGATVLAGRETLRTQEGRLIQNVITAYVDVRRDRETVTILKDEIANLRREFDETTAKGQLGQLTKTDVAESEARLLSAQAQLNLAQGRLNVSNAEYLNVVGESPADLDPEPRLAGAPANVDQAFEAADHNNPQLLDSIETERSAREKVNQAKAAYGPTVSFKIDASVAPVEPYLRGEYARGVTGALVVNQPIFTSGLNSSRVREAEDRDNEALLNVESARRGVVQLVAQAWSQLASIHSAVAIQARQVEVERIAVEGNGVEERVGLRSTIDLLNAEQELANSRVSLVQGRHDEYVAQAALLSAMGLLEVRFLIPGSETDDPVSPLGRAEKVGATPWQGAMAAIDSIGGAKTPPPRLSVPSAGATRPADLPPAPTPTP
ncbi:MAG TPA: TolC family outer membrane protein [Caulobacteraceae bacterium]|jgi:outer membrane protein|nr:TolC family outer membrane protein [Caulobacteraceae bacterium]